jgi:putative endonuclease
MGWQLIRPQVDQLQRLAGAGNTAEIDLSASVSRTQAQRQGAWAEQRVLRLLLARGWQLLDRNWRCRWGEIDLVMAKPGRLLLVEVKARQRRGADGGGRAALGPGKRLRLQRAWSCWVAAHPRWGETPVEQVAALVPLPPARQPVLWIRMES